MKRLLVPCLALLIAAAPVAAAAQDHGRRGGREDRGDAAQDRGPRGGRDDRGSDSREDAPRVNMGQAVQRASSGRPGRFLGASERGGMIVVRWEYPGGRVADIMVDGRTGQVVGER